MPRNLSGEVGGEGGRRKRRRRKRRRRRRRRSGLPELPLTVAVDMSHDVLYNSDPDTQGRCSVRLQLQALYVAS